MSAFLKFINSSRTAPIILAMYCTGMGYYIFREVPEEITEGTGVKSAAVFRLTVLLFLWRLKVYPNSLRKLGRVMQSIVEFFLSMFVVEYLQADFWVPLEKCIRQGLVKLSEILEDKLREFEIECGEKCEYIANEWTGLFVCYAVSMFFFISVLHGTRLIDLRETKYGPEPFIHAIIAVWRRYQILTTQKRYKQHRHGRGITGGRDRSRHGGNQDVCGASGSKGIGWREDQKAIQWRDQKDANEEYDSDSDY